jgi:hypothetical protein
MREDAMSVTFPSPPSDGLATLERGLRAIRTAQQLDPRGGAAALVVSPNSSALRPHPVYELGLDDLAAGKGIEAARPVAWRYLLVSNGQARQAAEVIPDPRGGGSQFGALTTGFVAGEEEALRVADQLPEIKQGTYEIRALRAPALYVMALWLKDVDGDDDRFIVMPPAFPPVQSLYAYPTSDLLAVLHQVAQQKAPMERNVTPS